MSKIIKHYKVQLFNEQYSLASDEPEENILQSVDIINATAELIQEKASGIDNKNLVLLVALHIANEFITLKKVIELDRKRQLELVQYMQGQCSDTSDTNQSS